MKCKKCGKEHDGSFGSGKFCSISCANSRIQTKQANEHRRQLLSKPKDSCIECGKTLSYRNTKTKMCMECFKSTGLRQKIITESIQGKVGGLRKGSGKGKKGWYKSYWCDSSWELAYVIYNLEHNIKFDRNKQGFEYIYEGKIFNYYPDFLMEDGSYIEVKGYMDKKNKAKHQQFNGVLNVLEKNEIKPYLKYVIDKYGKNFIELYE